jgi:hypothetical protein
MFELYDMLDILCPYGLYNYFNIQETVVYKEKRKIAKKTQPKKTVNIFHFERFYKNRSSKKEKATIKIQKNVGATL